MKAYGKSWDYNVFDCRNCMYWEGAKKGCFYPDGCCRPTEQNSSERNGAKQFREEEDIEATASVLECRGCPYGHDSPCIGWCTKEVMRAVGLQKERDSPHV